MEIYAVLKADHKIVKQLLKELEATDEDSSKKRVRLMQQLKEALIPHARAEERVLYDRLKRSDVKDADTLGFEGYEEHALVDHLMMQLESTQPNDKKWTALITIVKEMLEHHIEEEEDELFKKAKKAFERREAVAMAEEFQRMKSSFLKQVRSGKTPAQEPSTELVEAA